MTGFFAAGQWWDITAQDQRLIARSSEKLTTADIDNALAEARALFAAAQAQHDRFDTLIQQRANRTPMSHLLGYRDFYNHRFQVTSDVLDPRPETEILVIEALKTPFQTVLDLGTGSGCILLSMLAENRNATGVGTDISANALKVAQTNSQTLGLSGKASFKHSDWYSSVTGQFDLIVSNPPYIALSEMADLAPEVRNHEPRQALTDEGDGLACYRAIFAGAPQHLRSQGVVMVEIGPTQASDVSAIMADNGFGAIRVVADLDGRDRVVMGKLDAK